MKSLSALLPLLLALPIPLAPATAQEVLFDEFHRMLPRLDGPSGGAVLLDADSDGSPDLLVSTPLGHRLLLGDPSGRFSDAASALPGDAGSPAAMGDVDGDGDDDVLLFGTFEQHILWLGDGAGGFQSVPFPSSQVLQTNDAAFIDVDGDGDLDAVVVGFPVFTLGGRAQLFLNDGTGAFVEASAAFPADADTTMSMAHADLEGDGDVDVLIGNSPFAPNRLYANQGNGTFADASSKIPLDTNDTHALEVGDLDGDGDLDVFVGNSGALGLSSVWRNDGTGTFSVAAGAMPSDLRPVWKASLGDAEGDGDLDALIGLHPATGDPGVSLLLNDGGASFVEDPGALQAEGVVATVLAFVDVDMDGDLDAYAGAQGPDRLFFGDGTGRFVDPGPDVGSTGAATAVLSGDVDGDGDLDVLLGGENQLWRGDPVQGFSLAVGALPAGLPETKSGDLGDVDGDGDVDVLWGTAGVNRLDLNDGGGVFAAAPSRIPAEEADTAAVELADLDGDGDLDAFLANFPSDLLFPADGENTVWRNDGTGTFTSVPGAVPADLQLSFEVGVGDVDGDGDLDVFVGNVASFVPGLGPDRLYLNDGAGAFTHAPVGSIPVDDVATPALVLFDPDGDGDLDAYLGSNEGQADRFYENGGGGVFTDASGTFPGDTAGTRDAAALDANGDGDLDLFATRRQEGARLWLGDGAGAFVPAEESPASVGLFSPGRLALGDFDGDGDVDAWISVDGPDALWSGLLRHTAWRATPRIGKVLTMDVFGPSLEPWILAFSEQAATSPLPPLGTLHLDPAHIVLLGAGVLDAGGRASVELHVPPAPSLAGATFHAQSTVGAPPLLTNAETATFTSL